MRGRQQIGDDGPVTTTMSAPPRPTLLRSQEHRIFGGVVSGLAEHLGLDSRRARQLLRLAFIGLAFSSGLGVVLYGAYWIVLPNDERPDQRPERPLWVRYVAGAIAAVVTVYAVSQTVSLTQFFVPIALAVLGGALVWRQASENQREQWTKLSTSSLTATARGRTGVIRLSAGAAMVVIGVLLVAARGASLREVLTAVLVVVVVAAGFALITGPLWVRMVAQLSAERRELIRVQERADLAARVHDSVLQTLALIQRNADRPREVARLARGQERELRGLLYGTRTTTGRLAAALHDAVAEVEDSYSITVDTVVVGDVELNGDLDALVQAVREAVVNAAKHAQVETVSLYAEVEADQVLVFVRDRGRGFDLEGVPADRQGLRGSITARLERHGGTVKVRSAPGQGTEIEMTIRQ
jgi:signal transduction histidine kinase/phage shock protein PspC (stress-responsive transcriptional regulator)